MKKLVLALLVISGLINVPVTATGDLWLVELDLSSAWEPSVKDSELRLLSKTDRFALLSATPKAIFRMEDSGMAITVVTEYDADHQYYIMQTSPSLPHLDPPQSDFLLSEGFSLIIRPRGFIPPGNWAFFSKLPESGYPMDRLFSRPYEGVRSKDHDPAIQILVDEVTQADLYTILETLVNFQTRYSYATGCVEATNWVKTYFEGLGLTAELYPHTSGMAPNVTGFQVGQINPDKIWIVCGHIDSITYNEPMTFAPGADDNGTGSALTILAADILHDHIFEDSIIYALWTGEEQGLYGSGAWAADMASQGMDIQGVFNFDMIGWEDPVPEDLNVIVNNASQQLGQDFVDAVNLYTTLPMDYIVDGSARASDHAEFWDNGYAALLGIEDYFPTYPHYHTDQDTLDKVQFGFFELCTEGLIGALATMAKPVSGIVMSDYSIDDSSGDSDGNIDPGETIELTVTLINDFPDTMTNVQAVLVPAEGSQWVTLIDGESDFGSMGAYVSADNSSDPFIFSVDMSTPEATEIGFNLQITADGGYSNSVGMQFDVTARYYECPIYAWNLNLNPGWTTTGNWAWGQPTGGSGDHGGPDPTSGYTDVNVFGYNLNGGYTDDMPEYSLTAGPIDFTGIFDAQLQFARWLGVESSEFDHARIQISLDGSSFSNIWENGGTIDDSVWSYVSYDMGSQCDDQPQVWIRWTMGPTDGGWTYCGWNIDDIQICGYVLDPVAPTPSQTAIPPTNTPEPPPSATPVPPTPTVPTGGPTNTPVPSTNTPVPPTNTSVPPTNTPIPPTDTPILPTDTPVPPTDTPVPPSPTVPTGAPTNTPIPPSNTPVPPTETPSCTTLGVQLWMPATYYHYGDICSCKVFLCNPGSERFENIPLFVVLDIYGMYFFAPSFSDYDVYSIDLEPGKFELSILPEFTWPAESGSMSGITWYAAMTDPQIQALFGEMDVWTFGWGP
jgi:Peptidase family M28